jgi:hypothetical protein
MKLPERQLAVEIQRDEEFTAGPVARSMHISRRSSL